jgi:hypothetical protein
MLQPFLSFLDVSRSFAGRMRDDRAQRFEADAGSLSSHASATWPHPDLFEGAEEVPHLMRRQMASAKRHNP